MPERSHDGLLPVGPCCCGIDGERAAVIVTAGAADEGVASAPSAAQRVRPARLTFGVARASLPRDGCVIR